MSVVIAARFVTFAAANSAAHALFAVGVPPDAISVFFASDPKAGSASSSDLDQDPRKLFVRFQAQAHVSGLSMLGAILGAALVMTFDGPALAMVAAGAVGAFLGAWVGVMWLASRSKSLNEERRNRYALMTARVSSSQEQEVIQILLDAGSDEVERARGQWLHGQWIDTQRPIRSRASRSSSNRTKTFAHRGRQMG